MNFNRSPWEIFQQFHSILLTVFKLNLSGILWVPINSILISLYSSSSSSLKMEFSSKMPHKYLYYRDLPMHFRQLCLFVWGTIHRRRRWMNNKNARTHNAQAFHNVEVWNCVLKYFVKKPFSKSAWAK